MSSKKVVKTFLSLWKSRQAQPRRPGPRRDQVNHPDIWGTFYEISRGWEEAYRFSQPMYGAPFGRPLAIIISDKTTKDLAPGEILKLYGQAPQRINPPVVERPKIDAGGVLRFALDLSDNKNIYLDRESRLEIHLIIQGKQGDKNVESARRVFCLESPLKPNENGIFIFEKDLYYLYPKGSIKVANVEIPRDAIFFFVS